MSCCLCGDLLPQGASGIFCSGCLSIIYLVNQAKEDDEPQVPALR